MGADRKKEVIQAAFDLIARKGLEGLRTREVAAACNINPATLHYYFPTKEALIQGVVDHLVAWFSHPIDDLAVEAPMSAAEAIRWEFQDSADRMRRYGEFFQVLAELWLRANRDPVIGRILETMNARWHNHLVSLLKQGVESGEFRADLDLDVTASNMMTQLRGLGFQIHVSQSRLEKEIEELIGQILGWLAAS